MLLVALVVVPLIGAFAVVFRRGRSINLPLIFSAIVLIMGIFGLKNVFEGAPLTYSLPLSGPFVPTFRADPLSVIFLVLAAFLWLIVSIYAPAYMKHEGGTKRFEFCTLLTLSAVIGVLLAGDLFTMLLFFELMTVVSYFWVIHRRNNEAFKAGYFYLFFGIIGGLFLALGIVLLNVSTDSLPAIGSGFVTPLNPKLFGWGIALLVVGFGIKAGMAPLHIWLPHAHSAAPTPSSALLSGMLIKIGAYGLIRVGEFAGWGIKLVKGVAWLAPVLTIIGISTMLIGVMAALLQSDAKRLLAYHSVSQMGYIILGLGIALYLGHDGSLGLLGAIYHIVNHALFKVALFLGVGVIYINTKETDLYKLGGLWRRFPVTAIFMLVAVLGITGTPGLNGYASKTLLHHAVTMSAETGTPWLVWIERLFLVVGVGTATSFAKLYYLIFLGKPTKIKVTSEKSPRLQLAIGILAVIMVGIGLAPKFIPNIMIVPAAQELGMKLADSALIHISFWNSADVISMIITLILGVLFCWFGLSSGIFHWSPPIWMTIEGLAKLASQETSIFWRIGAKSYRWIATAFNDIGKVTGSYIYSANRRFNRSRSAKIGGTNYEGIGADAALLIVALTILIIWYTLVNPVFQF